MQNGRWQMFKILRIGFELIQSIIYQLTLICYYFAKVILVIPVDKQA